MAPGIHHFLAKAFAVPLVGQPTVHSEIQFRRNSLPIAEAGVRLNDGNRPLAYSAASVAEIDQNWRRDAGAQMRQGEEISSDKLKTMQDVWQSRLFTTRGFFRELVRLKEQKRKEREEKLVRREKGETAGEEATKSAFAASAGAVFVGALILRLGGRAALVGLLGLNAVAEMGIGDQIDQVLQYADSAGGWTIVLFLGGWVIAKVFCLDVISIALAAASGLLFGGVFQGALISGVCATIGSLVAFGLGRSLLQKRVANFIAEQPVARGLAKLVEEDGFKTVLVLRLSPILPIPLGSYSYVYGSTKLNPLTFASATFLGGLKPYIFDSYVGVFSKQVIDGTSLDDTRDVLLLLGVGALVLTGVFATDLAKESWEKVQEEVAAEERKREEETAAGMNDNEERSWDGKIGPIDTAKVSSSLVSVVPEATRKEVAEDWQTANQFCDEQWPTAVNQAMELFRLEEQWQEQYAQVVKNSSMDAKDAIASLPELKVDKTPTEADLVDRKRMAKWSLDGEGPWRELSTTGLFGFALMSSLRRQWLAYPDSVEELEQVASSVTAMEVDSGSACGSAEQEEPAKHDGTIV